MRAEIIAVGSELLTPARVDTNSLFITERLSEIGIDLRVKSIVGDNRGDLASLFNQALDRSDLVIMTGGLGPTDDDVTREAVAGALGLPLDEDETIVESISQRFASRGWRMPAINRRQGMVPRGAIVLANPNGTAPGLWIERGSKIVVLLPGPPRELKPMVEALVRERLTPRAGAARFYHRVLRVTGRTESHVEEAAQPLYAQWQTAGRSIEATTLAAFGQIELHLKVRAASAREAAALLDEAAGGLQEALGKDLFSTDGRSMEEVVGALLRERGLRIAVAESCTGGLTTSRLTDVPGSSDYVERGFIAYSNPAKTELLDVDPALIAEHGAVSEAVAAAMAAGARARAGTDVGLGITGVAGPGGGTPAKPVGTVAIAAVWGTASPMRTFRFLGGREQVKFQASQAALDMLRRMLLDSRQ